MTDIAKRLAEIRERAEKATPGPWHIGHVDEWNDDLAEIVNVESFIVCTAHHRRDQAFLASCRTDIPFLLDLVSKYQAALERCKTELNYYIMDVGRGDEEQAEIDAELDAILGGKDE